MRVTTFLQAINPARPVKTEDEARAAARAGAWGAFLMAAPGMVVALNMLFTTDAYLAKLRTATVAMYGEGSAMAQSALLMMTPQFVYFTAVTSLVFALVIVVLGVVQWRKPNLVIPLILGLLTAYGLLMLLLGLLRANPATAAMAIPMWRNVLAGVVDVACLVLFWAGFRGGKQLSALRRAAAV
jgi:hypothetical protein